MSELYQVEVTNRPDDRTVELYIKVIHPDAMYIYDTPGFYLMLLQECPGTGNQLATELDYGTVADANWLKKYARGFIEDVEIISLENKPPKAALNNSSHKYWEAGSAWLSGTIRIRVTDPAWVAHVENRLAWESAAYDPNTRYNKCAPILPESEAESDEVVSEVDYSQGFLPVPNYFFAATSGLLSPIIWIPKYGENAYKPLEKIAQENLTEEVMKSFLGKLVAFEGGWSSGPGILTGMNSMFTISDGSMGIAGMSRTDYDWMGLATFNTRKKRLKDPMNYHSLLRRIDPMVAEVKLDGKTAIFTVYTFQENAVLKLETTSEALTFLSRSVVDNFGTFFNEKSKLSQFLQAKKEEYDVHFLSQVITKVASGMVVRTAVSKVKDASHPDFDTLNNDEIIEVLQTMPWATWEISLEMSDAAWIEHLPSAVPFEGSFSMTNPPESWEGELLTWKGE